MTARAARSSPDWWRWFWTGLVIALFCVPLFVGLGRTDDENDEAIYSFAVDVMVKSGDWLTPKSIPSEQEAFLEKPPLKFWIVAAPIRLGLLPHDEFGRRFWDALFGGIAFLYVFAIGRRLGGPLCGAAAVLVLFAHTPLLFQHGLRGNNMEAAVVLAYCAGVYHFIGWRTDGRPGGRRRHVLALALCFVLAFMTKFVAALFLPLVLAVIALLSPEDRARLREDWRTWCGAALLAVALIAPWFLYQYHQFGADLWDVMFGQHVMTRFTSYLDPTHLHPWHYYVTQMFAQLRASQAVILAIVGLVLMAAGAAGYLRATPIASAHQNSFAGTARLVLLWFALPLGLMSLLSSKLYHYAYPFIPPVALCAGYATAVVFGLLWAVGARPSRRLDDLLADRLPRGLSLPWVRAALLALGFVAVAVALATHAAGGRLHLTIGDTLLFRNASAMRAWLVAALLFALAARLGTAVRAGVAAGLVLMLLPLPAYSRALSQLPVERHPLRSLAQCLQAVNARAAEPARRAPGVWVEAESIAHTYFYYLRDLGPWQYRRERREASDATVYMHLYVASQATPVLLSGERYTEFSRRANAGDPDLLEWVARKSGMDVPAVAAGTSQTRVSILRFGPEVLLLPGPYADCAFDPQVRGHQ
jgi:4-amino-4-deoxy-L-arabinose transferase-like glycosyltransferase